MAEVEHAQPEWGAFTGTRKVLAIAPHPDDAELGIGGIILTLIAKGHEVHMLDLTNGEPTPKGDPATRAKEAASAAKILGVKSRTTLDLPNRYLQDTLDARTKVSEVIRQLRPDVLLVPYWLDSHPDHVATSHICQAAQFQAKYTKTAMKGKPWFAPKIFFYLCSHLSIQFPISLIIDVSAHFDRKIEAARCYPSQFEGEDGHFQVSDFLRRHNSYYGSLIKAAYGEPLFSREPVGATDLRDII